MLEKSILAIYDTDSLYGHALGEYIANYGNLFSVIIFDEIPSLLSYTEKSKADIFLINENAAEYLTEKGMQIVWLLENPPDKLMKAKDGNTIYKYMSAEKIIEELKYICVQESINDINLSTIDKRSQCIGFYSSSGGAGTTSIAICVSRVLAMRDKKVLYLNFEAIPSTKSFFVLDESKRNMSDFLYYLFIKEGQNISALINSFTVQDKWGVHTFIPQSNYNDLLQLTCDETTYLFETLCTGGNYDYICIDFSPEINEKKILMLSLCYKIFNIIGDFEPAKTKAEIFFLYCNSSNNLAFVNNSVPVYNFCSEGKEAELFIENDAKSFNEKDDVLAISLDGKFGKGVRKVVSHIIWE
ncbi:MAG: AAA family ATPase [Clostridiales bacterium]|nr:AAA family ATPase [Clostridiales bacterium]